MSASTPAQRRRRATWPTLVLAGIVGLVAGSTPLRAQTAASWSEDFQSIPLGTVPPGWSVPQGTPPFVTARDPEREDNHVLNFQTGEPFGVAFPGTFVTLTSRSFSAEGGFHFSGRFRTAGVMAGVTFFSSLPERQSGYLLGSRPDGTGRRSVQLLRLEPQLGRTRAVRRQESLLLATTSFVPESTRWTRFRIDAEETAFSMILHIRLWHDGDPEPASDTVLVRDDRMPKLASGRIGVWGAGVGDGSFDDLSAGSFLVGTPTPPTPPPTPPPPPTSGTGLSVLSPASGVCIGAETLEVRGSVTSDRVTSVLVRYGGAAVSAAFDAGSGAWSTTLSAGSEGRKSIAVEARDAGSVIASLTVPIVIDRTKPIIEVTEGGTPFLATALNRALSLFVRVIDLDPAARLTLRLDGSPWVSGAAISAEGAHRLELSATDCAGLDTTRTVLFEIDRASPQIRSLDPASSSTVGERPAVLRGVADPDVVSVKIAGRSAGLTADGSFHFDGLTLEEGRNDFTLELIDRAGNRSETAWTFTLKTGAPSVEITEDGSAIVTGSIFNRALTVVVRSSDSTASLNITLDGVPFTSGTAISTDGSHVLTAKATDTLGHTTTREVSFTIDRIPPAVKITSPQPGSTPADRVEVRGTAGDAVEVAVNGVAATLSPGGSFAVASLPLEAGDNLLRATGRDRAGNLGHDEVALSVETPSPGIIINSPLDRSVTNRPAVEVSGRVLSPAIDGVVTIGAMSVPVDPTGLFRLSRYSLVEGENTIVISARGAGGKITTATLRITADFLPPQLQVMESGQSLAEGARFPQQAVITAEASDNRSGTTLEVTIDGARLPASALTAPSAPSGPIRPAGGAVTVSTPVSTVGGHTLVALARDAAGNESRLERTFFVGASAAGGCRLDAIDPQDGATIFGRTLRVVGRSGGALGVSVGGTRAELADGSFLAMVELPNEGANPIAIRCTDPAGSPIADPVVITLYRVTGEPTVTIASPEEASLTAQEMVTVTGTVGPGVDLVDVNGIPGTIAAGEPLSTRGFSTASVRLTGGINILVAHARNSAFRTSAASRRVIYLQKAPAIVITSPAADGETGVGTIEISGTWTDLDPSTLRLGSLAPGLTAWNDTSGAFRFFDVPLIEGENSLPLSGQNRLGVPAASILRIRRLPGVPSISISAPADNHYVSSVASDSVSVAGSFTARGGAIVEVGGSPAVVSSSGSFSAVASLTAGVTTTPVVARLTEPEGAAAIDTIRIHRLPSPLRVLETFPANNAREVDPGTLIVLLFSAPIDSSTHSSTVSGIRLQDEGGLSVTTLARTDRDVIALAPTSLLPAGRYTLTVGPGVKDLAGNTLVSAVSSSFTITASAPATPPALLPIEAAACALSIEVRGTAAPGARLRIDHGTVAVNATASSTGTFTVSLPLAGQSGFGVVRVRIVGGDGSLSPAAEAPYRIDCGAPQVLAAAFDPLLNRLTISFSEPVKPSTLIPGAGGTIVLSLDDGGAVGGALSMTGSAVVVTPSQSLASSSFLLLVTTGVEDLVGNKLTAEFRQRFTPAGASPPQTPGDGSGFIAGEVYDATTGRPLAGATITVSPLPAGEGSGVRGGDSEVSSRARVGVWEGRGTSRAALMSIEARVGDSAFRSSASAPAHRVRHGAAVPYASVQQLSAHPKAGETPALHALSPLGSLSTTSDARGRYTLRLPEGAHTIRVSAPGQRSVWRQIVVAAGAGVVPIDIRLTATGASQIASGTGPITLTGGGETSLTRRTELMVPSAAVAAGTSISLTPIAAQSLPGLLPLGWSPLAVAAIEAVSATTLSGAQLTFHLSVSEGAEVTAAFQILTLVQYDEQRDEWHAIQPVVSIAADGKTTVPITMAGTFALVYPDRAPRLSAPPAPVTGSALLGVPSRCAENPSACILVEKTFGLDPPIVVPTGKSVATLTIEGGAAATFPSGTAVQASISEELRLTDGSTIVEPPFVTDLLLYRSLSGEEARADFALAPSTRASEVILSVGFETIRILPYPGRLDRGTLIGSEGGRVPGDQFASLEIPAGATSEPLHATSVAMSSTNLAAIGPVAGFRVAGGFALSLTRASSSGVDLDGDGKADPLAPVELSQSARATFSIDASSLPFSAAQVVVAEVIEQTAYGRIIRVTGLTTRLDSDPSSVRLRFTLRPIDRSALPVDGIVREGRYLVLAAEQPVAFATGVVRLGGGGRVLESVKLTAPPLGIADVSRPGGVFAVVVPAQPATPFTLIPSHSFFGTGASFTALASPTPDSIVRIGDLALATQPPVVSSITPAGGAADVSLTTTVRVAFSAPLAAGSIESSSIVVTEVQSGRLVPGSAAADGGAAILWTMPPAAALRPGSRHLVTISSSIRGANGAPLPQSIVSSFTTRSEIVSAEVHFERIRITIPDERGISLIAGDPGALPAGWQAVALRRGVDFVTRYQAAAAADGSFGFAIGGAGAGDLSDRVTLGDVIDLQIINAAGNVAAIRRLTPFVSSDRRGFIAPEAGAVRFVSADNIVVIVPDGAFDRPVLVRVEPSSRDALAAVPSLDAEVNVGGSVRLDFQCEVACTPRKPLDVEIPATAPPDPARTYLLALLGESIRGPRLMIVDTLRYENGKFTTMPSPLPAGEGSGVRVVKSSAISSPLPALRGEGIGVRGVDSSANLVIKPAADVKPNLLHITHPGTYSVVDLNLPPTSQLAWAFVEATSAVDLFTDTFRSLYVSGDAIRERGGALIPIATNRPFTLVGVDSTTGLERFRKAYDPIIVTGGGIIDIAPPESNTQGPYPVHGTPFRVEVVDLESPGIEIESVKDLHIRLEEGGFVRVTPGPPLSGRRISILNVTRGGYDNSLGGPLSLPAAAGDRIVILSSESDVDPATPLSIVFSEPIHAGPEGSTDQFLRQHFDLSKAGPPSGFGSPWVSVNDQATYSIDSRRRVNMAVRGELERGALYRLTVRRTITELSSAGRPALKLGEIVEGGVTTSLPDDLRLEFSTRSPKGLLDSFDIERGSIRDMALAGNGGNVLLVSALDGGLLAYDTANPAELRRSAAPKPFAFVPGSTSNDSSRPSVQNWAVAADSHGRIFATALTTQFGVIRSYRLEDFLAARSAPSSSCSQSPNAVCRLVSNAIVSYAPGVNINMPMGTQALVDRPEATPRKMQILVQDDTARFDLATFKQTNAAAVISIDPDGSERLDVTIGYDSSIAYLVQRITIENATRELRWSADASPSAPAAFRRIVAGPRDEIRLIRNRTTYGVVSLFGYGIGVYDLNAIESNDVTGKPAGYATIAEKIVLTRGEIESGLGPSCVQSEEAPLGIRCPIPDLEFSPEAGILPSRVSSKLGVFALDASRGMLDVEVTPPFTDAGGVVAPGSALRAAQGLVLTSSYGAARIDHPRLATLREAFVRLANREPSRRFTTVATFRRDAQSASGAQRASATPGKTYLLVSALEYGLLVVEPTGGPLADADLADVIWIPPGVFSVRTIPGTTLVTAVDGEGRVLLIDLSRIDERAEVKPVPNCASATCLAELFPTASRALAAGITADGVGAWDPRVIWKSNPHFVTTTLAPLIDPKTGILYAGDLLGREIDIVAAIDARLRVRADTGDPVELRDVSGVVPQGIAAPAYVFQCSPVSAGLSAPCNASLAAIQIDTILPPAIAESLAGGELPLILESEVVPGAAAWQTPSQFPRSQLRVALRSVIPPDLRAELRNQPGAGRFVSPWIVVIADPRASERYLWNYPSGVSSDDQKRAYRESQGCHACERPSHLRGKTETDGVFELWSAGHSILLRLDPVALAGTPYAYLAEEGRMQTRIATIPADTIRPPGALSSTPPSNGTMTEGSVYLHSGEVAFSTTDLGVQGRGHGITFALTRFYSSAAASLTPFGRNFDSSLFARLRPLPDGSVDYFDGTGRIDTFRLLPGGGFASPAGIFLRLTKGPEGQYVLTTSDDTRLHFDALGRIARIVDRNTMRADYSDGNNILFFYDASGRLATILDATRRPYRFRYNSAGLVERVTDYVGRVVEYTYDSERRLVRVSGPDPKSPMGSATGTATPSTSYRWAPNVPGTLREALFSTASLLAEIDGEGREVFSVRYRPDEPWSAAELTSGGGKWSFSYLSGLTTVSDPNSRLWAYTLDAIGRVVSVSGPGGAKTNYSYDEEHRLLAVEQPLGDRSEYMYASASGSDKRGLGNVLRVTQRPRRGSEEDSVRLTRTRQLAYGPANQVIRTVEPDGTVTVIDRDPRGNPVKVTDATGAVTSYGYNDYGQVLESTDTRSGRTEYKYEENDPLRRGYLTAVMTSAGTTSVTSDNRGNAVRIADASGKTVTRSFNELDQLEKETRGSSSSTSVFDRAGNLKRHAVLAGTDAAGNPVFSASEYDIDEVGRTRAETQNGVTSRYQYDAKGNVTEVSRAATPTVRYTYDERDRIASMSLGSTVTRYAYDENDVSSSVTDARGQTTSFVLNGFGETVGQVDAQGVQTVNQTDSQGRPVDSRVVKRAADGKTLILRWSKREYDPLGRVTREIQKLFEQPLELPADGTEPKGGTDIVTEMLYDDAGHKTTRIDPRGNGSVTETDEMGRTVRTTDAAGNIVEFTYDANNNRKSETMTELGLGGERIVTKRVFEYDDQNRVIGVHDVSDPARTLSGRSKFDERGQLLESVDAEGRVTKFEYDLRGRRTKMTDAEVGVTGYGYDEADRLISVTDPKGNETRFAFDEEGNLASETRADGVAWRFTWDENHNRKTVTDPNGTVVSYQYDAVNRHIGRTILKGAGVLGPASVTMTLDDLGRAVAAETDDGVKSNFVYDSLDRQLRETMQLGTGPARTITKRYDPASNLVAMTYPSGLELKHTLDPLNRIQTVSGIVTYTDAGLRPATRTLANGIVDTWSYDPNRRLIELRASPLPAGEGSGVRVVQYERTPSGNKRSILRPDLQKKSTLDYNANYWMTSEQTGIPMTEESQPPEIATTYRFDRALNIAELVRNGASTTPTVNSRHQYTSFGGETLAYDRSGNLTSKGGMRLAYDADSHPRQITIPGGGTIERLYDAMGRKVEERTILGGATQRREYVNNGAQVVEEIFDGKIAARYVNGRGIDEIVRVEQSSRLDGTLDRLLYPIQDELGNVERITDAAGATLERYEYEGYGTFRVYPGSPLPAGEGSGVRASSDYTWRHFFQGREYHALTSSYDFRARTLWPDLARFGEEDPSGSADSSNPYQAFLGDPQSNTDPTGEVVVLMHGVKSSGGWAQEMSQALGAKWQQLGADPGQDVINLVSQRGGGFGWGAEGDQFSPTSADNASHMYFDPPTRRAGEQTANFLKMLRAALDGSDWRRGEPISVLAHSHGTAIMLSAARQNRGRFHLQNVILTGSDMSPVVWLADLEESAATVYNFFSPEDGVVSKIQGAGAQGFHEFYRGGTRMLPDVPGKFYQRKLRGVAHVGPAREKAFGEVPWMSELLVKQHYGAITALKTHRPAADPESWITSYEKVRRQMGLWWTIGLRNEFRLPYPLP